jgi:RNA polymerase sigma factor (sigma-70 family)
MFADLTKAACTATTERAQIISPARAMTVAERSNSSPERLFLDHLDVIERIVAIIARRHSMSAADAEEFGSWSRGRLMDSDYAILRKFGGRSSMATYLSVVLSNLYRDYRNSVWGRWRPSAAAVRFGPLAIRLEELVSRDGCSVREAVAILKSRGASATDAELTRLAARLPFRSNDRTVSVEAVEESLAAPQSSLRTLDDERAQIEHALLASISELPDEDRVITRMRFWDGLSVADIAKALRVDQKPLYRRIETIQRRLRDTLARHGITQQRAQEVLAEEGIW